MPKKPTSCAAGAAGAVGRLVGLDVCQWEAIQAGQPTYLRVAVRWRGGIHFALAEQGERPL